MYDYLIVGAGLFGSVCARELSNAGKNCLVIDKRNHIGGNCYTDKIEGINIHKYGPHIFHTSNNKVWNYINNFAKFNNYINRVKVKYKNNIYSFPINLMTLYQIWGVKTPDEAKSKLESVRIHIDNPNNLEEWALSQVGEEIYNIFIKGYTTKQWGRAPSDLPSFIIRRLPIRLTFDDNYYHDIYQGIPIGGYTNLFYNLLKGIEVKLAVDYFKEQKTLNKISKRIIYTGKIDEFFNYRYGELEYLTLRFENEVLNISDYQGNAVINYTEEQIPYTRIIEHNHFEYFESKKTVITKEYPDKWHKNKIPYYPVNNYRNNLLFSKYKKLSQNLPKVIFGGRLAEYKYYDMDEIIESALNIVQNEVK